MLAEIFGLIKTVTKPITGLIDNLSTSEEEKLLLKNKFQEIQNELAIAVMEHEDKKIKAQKEIIIAEIKGSWLTQNWRPVLMLTIVFIVANNYIIYPYLSLFWEKAVILDLPKKLWTLMEIGVGGYVVGRSGEKIVENLNKKNK